MCEARTRSAEERNECALNTTDLHPPPRHGGTCRCGVGGGGGGKGGPSWPLPPAPKEKTRPHKAQSCARAHYDGNGSVSGPCDMRLARAYPTPLRQAPLTHRGPTKSTQNPRECLGDNATQASARNPAKPLPCSRLRSRPRRSPSIFTARNAIYQPPFFETLSEHDSSPHGTINATTHFFEIHRAPRTRTTGGSGGRCGLQTTSLSNQHSVSAWGCRRCGTRSVGHVIMGKREKRRNS